MVTGDSRVDGRVKHGIQSPAAIVGRTAGRQDGRSITMISMIRPCRFRLHPFSSSSPPCPPTRLPLSGFGIFSFPLAGSPDPQTLSGLLLESCFFRPSTGPNVVLTASTVMWSRDCAFIEGISLKTGGLASHFDTLKLSVFLSPANGHVNLVLSLSR